MKAVKTQFTLAACIRADGWNTKKISQWQGRYFSLILDLGYITDSVGCSRYLRTLGEESASNHNICIRLMLDDLSVLDRLLANNPTFKAQTIILALPKHLSKKAILSAKRISERVFIEIYSEDMALQAQKFKADGLVIRGNEAGGICSNKSNPILLRNLRDKISLPIWMLGGIGAQSALAYAIGGADGVILSDSLALLSDFADDLKEHDIKALKTGIRTQAVDIGNGLQVRISESYPDLIDQLRALCTEHDRLQFEKNNHADTRLTDVLSLMTRYQTTTRCFVGEEVGWAHEFSRRFATIQGLAEGLTQDIPNHLAILKKDYPLARGNALAKELKAEFPILQGPMTHVSDCPDFLAHVAQNGAIPFAALGLSKGEKIDQLLRETQKKVNGKTWGVGIIGFAPKELQDEQFEFIKKYKPDMAVVAGGRPSHYKALRAIGVIPFLHIPVPSMIANFFAEGVRHFIFEGRGCGGHIGPINSYALWQSALLEFQQLAAAGEDISDIRIAFAGGIYDAMSAAMTSAFCVPLLAHGVKFGFVVGTAYLFTREIIESAAITAIFQQVALDSVRTVIIEGGVGHAIRCAQTPLTTLFSREKASLLSNGIAPLEVQKRLEKLNFGRLRLAAKGVMRANLSDGDGQVVTYSSADQINEGLFMLGEVATAMDQVLSMTDLHQSICSNAAQALSKNDPKFFHSENNDTPVTDNLSRDIAIIGMSTLVPGAEDLDKFWHNILAEVYLIRDVPEERWNSAVNFNPDPEFQDTTYSKKGGFIEDIPINCMEYGIPPGSVSQIEPAQLLALEAVKQALMDAGYEKREFDRAQTSVFFGFAGGGDLILAYSVRAALKEYLARAQDIPDNIRDNVIHSVNAVLPEWTMDSFPGILGNVIAGRVANRFNLNGMNFTLDAACASSMAALQVACQELTYGASKMAIVGGVDTSMHLLGYTCFSKTKALSPSGQSKPFSPDADGIVLGEGVGVVVLKPLADAIKDRDRIYAVIKGIGGASDGKGSGMTVPVSHGQKMAIYRAYDVAGFKTDCVDLIEAHGTGTTLGDRVELETINEVLQKHGATQPCALGSIKSAIGHTKGAAGVIGVIKTALALYHKVLPAHVNVEKVHDAVSCPNTKLYLNTETRPWLRKAAGRIRRAGVSAFGFGGTNFHTVLEEFPARENSTVMYPQSLWPAELFLFGASDVKTLLKRIDATISLLVKAEVPLARFAFQHYKNQVPSITTPVRFAIRANSMKQLQEKLVLSKELITNGALQTNSGENRNAIRMGDGIWGAQIVSPVGPLAALFPGQGSQKINMLKDLALVFPTVRECLENANIILGQDIFPISQGVLTDYIYPPYSKNPDVKKQALSALTQTTVAQPALAAVEMALYCLLAQFNVKITMAAGHSFGELTALWAAGVLTDHQLLTLASKRGQCMANSSDVVTGMVAVQINREALKDYIDATPELSIANHNTPKQVVVSGSMAALEPFEAYCREQKWGYKRLPVSQGFHSPYMENAAKEWSAVIAAETLRSPNFSVYSNMTAKPYEQSDRNIADTLARHLRNGVKFVDEIEAMHSAGARTFIEIGPGSILTNFVGAILDGKPQHAIAVQPQENVSGVEKLLDGLATLFARGYDIDLQPAYSIRIKNIEKPKHAPSATRFLVNGGRAKPTVELRAKTIQKQNPSKWDSPPFPSVPHATTASLTVVNVNPIFPKTSLKAVHTQPMVNSEYTLSTEQKKHESVGPPQVKTKAKSFLSDQEKLKKMKYFQNSMNLFLEAQERFHKQRLEMMEKMWNVNQQLFQGLLGSEQAPTLPMGNDFALANDIKSQTPHDTPLDTATVSFTPQAAPKPANGYSASTASKPTNLIAKESQTPKPAELTVKPEQVDYRHLLFEIISERTQYPVDMLALDQNIEADLGIDSIKRVEIITMLRTTHPSLEDIANERYYEDMAQLKTLGDIVRWIEKNFGRSQAVSGQKTLRPQQPPAPVVSPDAHERVDYQRLLFEIISERTQYPVDMLALDQHIEADLGIDSIKRVEIITMLRTTHPSLEDIANERYYEDMAQLKTLGDIVRWIEKNFGRSHAVSDRKTIRPPQPQAPVVSPDAHERVDYQRFLFEVISERTQYPVDMLALDQNIEADLGIDSIKRVEIITMLRTTHPSLEDIANERYYEDMAQLKTLGDIVRWIDKNFGTPLPAPKPHLELSAEKEPKERTTLHLVDKVNYQQLVMKTISERTLYPVELLEMKLNIEEDLAIDTDQLIAIMHVLKDSHLSHEDISNENHHAAAEKLKTVQDLVQWMESSSMSKSDNDAIPVVVSANTMAAEEQIDMPVFQRYLLRLIEQPLDLTETRSFSGILMLLDGGHPLGKHIQIEAEKKGIRCLRVVNAEPTAPLYKNCIGLDFSNESEYERCYQQIKKSHGLPCGVLNLLTLGKLSHEDSYAAIIQSFLWAKTIGADRDLVQDNQWQLFWISVSGMGGDFGLNNSMDFEASQNGLHGITKSLFHEWPGLQAKTIDLHPDDDIDRLSQFVVHECCEVLTTIKEIGFLKNTRHAIALVGQPHGHDEIQTRFNSDSVFLITGGAKGITADVALLLAKLYSPVLIVTGRTPLPKRSSDDLQTFFTQATLGENDPRSLKTDIIKDLKSSAEVVTPALVNDRYNTIMKEYKARQNIEKMEQFNAKVQYFACDCTNDYEFSKTIRQIYKQYHKIDGVIHAAGYLKDALITQKTTDHFKRVLDTKVEGARILLREVDFERLDFIAFFSSVSGRFGNQGQADYAAANEVLNKMAVKINHQWPGKATAINWGPWEGEGMVSSELKKQFAEAGVYLLPRDVGAKMLNQEINLSERQSEVVIFGAKDIENRLPLAQVQDNSVNIEPKYPFTQLFEPKNLSGENKFSWQLILDQTAPYLDHHRINGIPVLPAAVAMEIMAQAAAAAVPEYQFIGIQGFKLLKGITFKSHQQLKLIVTVEGRQDGLNNSTMVDVRLTLPDQANRSNYAARVLLSKEKNYSMPDPLHFKHSQQFKHSVKEVYERRLFHSGVFCGLKSIDSIEIADLQNMGIKGLIEPSHPEQVIGDHISGTWLIDPIVFDCAYQLGLLWIQESYNMTGLPADIQKYTQYRPYNGSPIHCDVFVKNVNFPQILMDFIFKDDGGVLYAKAIDVAAIMSKGLNERLQKNPKSQVTFSS